MVSWKRFTHINWTAVRPDFPPVLATADPKVRIVEVTVMVI